MSDRIDDYLKHATACDALLRGQLTAEERALIAEMAKTWRSLAENRRKMLKMREKAK
jgi:hypothetical protein